MADALRPLDPRFDRPPAELVAALASLSPEEIADALELSQVMRHELRPLWSLELPRIAGPAFTVRTGKHDNLMFHAAIYLAKPGDVLVVEAGDDETAVAGGNVCGIAQRNGVVGLVIDGVMRDVPEARSRRFPVFARGVSPIAAKRGGDGAVGGQIRCGGVVVDAGDVVVADENGIVVVPRWRAADVLARARAKALADGQLAPEEWERRHRAGVEAALRSRGRSL